MRHRIAFIAIVAMAGVIAAPVIAAPRHHHRHHAYYVEYYPPMPEITVNKRSYLDAGVVVPQGTQEAYVAESTTLGAPYVVKDIFRDRFDSGLPNRFELPGRSEPLFEFETPGAPY
ncbi:MAG: hypothetical protein JO366_18365 [Methylobacteriaceae bacterium]|nr:hypothetical protein [Methylobacteriaceae bacterium]MBV9637132.1 hypothetical protein [Methylobacteriaceae bacterium]